MNACPRSCSVLSFGLALLLFSGGMAVPTCAQTQLVPAPSSPAEAIVSSPISGVVFQDAPRLLPVDTRFSQAIQTIGFDVGLACGQIEAYGWSVTPNEQERVNNIFAQTAEELARLGYQVLPQNPGSAGADITAYTAVRADKTVLFMWSAGNAGLLLLSCEARGDVTKQGFGPTDSVGKTLESLGPLNPSMAASTPAPASQPAEPAMVGKPSDIVGEWSGTYSCISQGPAGGTLTVSRVTKDRSGYAVNAQFAFYPVESSMGGKNQNLPRGSYRLSGRYDPMTHRALLEPGSWIQRPAGFTYAPLIAEFAPAATTSEPARVSALFQGTTGCTSFEGSLVPHSDDRAARKAWAEEPAAAAAKPAKKSVKKKKAAKPVAAAPASAAPTVGSLSDNVPGSTAADAPSMVPQVMPQTTMAPPSAPAAPPAVAAAPATATSGGMPAIEPTAPSVPAPSVVPATASPGTESPITVPAAPPAVQ